MPIVPYGELPSQARWDQLGSRVQQSSSDIPSQPPQRRQALPRERLTTPMLQQGGDSDLTPNSPSPIVQPLLETTQRQFSHEHTERIGEEEFGNLLAATGNHEAKSLLLIAMSPQIIYTKSDLHRLMLEKQGNNRVWNMSYTVPFGYCEQSLHPIGLVAQEITLNQYTYGYQKTAYGRAIGDALAGHLLALSEQHEGVSLIDLFGGTTSTSARREVDSLQGRVEYAERSPLTRYKIWYELLTSTLPLREVDLMLALGKQKQDAGTIEAHLINLQRKHIITFKDIPADQAFSFYKLAENPPATDPVPYRRYLSLTNNVYRFLQDHPEESINIETVYETVKDHSSDIDLKRRISSVLAYLTREGYAKADKFTYDRQTAITLTDPQRELLLDFVTLLDGFTQPDEQFLAEGRQKALEIVSDPSRFSALLMKAKEASPHANSLEQQEVTEIFSSILARHPNSSSSQIQGYLKEEYEIEYTRHYIGEILKTLREAHIIEANDRRNSFYYSLPENNSQEK